jgi:hypothetical protein
MTLPPPENPSIKAITPRHRRAVIVVTALTLIVTSLLCLLVLVTSPKRG